MSFSVFLLVVCIAGLAIFILLAAIVLTFGVSDSDLQRFASDNGLKYDVGNSYRPLASLKDKYRNHSIIFEHKYRQLLSSTPLMIEVRVALENERGAYLKLTKGVFSNSRLFPELEISDEQFDQKVQVIDLPVGIGREILKAGKLRRQLLGLGPYSIVLQKQELMFQQLNYRVNSANLQKIFDAMCLLADSIDAVEKGDLFHAPEAVHVD
jgi:hypothetical protein